MTPEQTIAREIWDIFAEPSPEKRKRYEHFRQQEATAGRNLIRFFSPFLNSHAELAQQISQRFFDSVTTAATELEGLRAVVQEYKRLEPTTQPDLLYYALRLFVTHYHGNVVLEIPSILVSEPELMVPSVGNNTPQERSIRLGIAAGSTEETKLDWFREDPLLNEHHIHWHVVYDRQQPLQRQGEMFFYMHRQMLARYNAERLALNVASVKAYDDFQKPITVGYAFGPDLRFGQQFDNRAPGLSMFSANVVSDQRNHLADLRRDITNGRFDISGQNDEIKQGDTLGNYVESNALIASLPGQSYANYHGDGHVAIANIKGGQRLGVMIDPTTAIRDVVFWEWHQGIDDVYRLWQERLPPYNFKPDASKTIVRKSVDAIGLPYSPDLILCRTNDLPSGITPEQAGPLLFGGANWDKDFGKALATANGPTGQPIRCQTADIIRTRMEAGTIQFRDTNGIQQSYSFPFVNHDEYSLFIRVENRNPVKTTVTVRLFLAPDSQVDDRTKWVELDKFLADLNPLEKKVIYRADTNSSVIRKPAVKNPATVGTTFDPTRIQANTTVSSCRCGFPYHMLWPRGTTAGMKFRLMVMLTDAEIDMGGQQPNCGSLSFCGTRNQRYPDLRPLGYPFNRPFAPAKGIVATIAGQDNMASRVLTIQLETIPPTHA